MSANFDDVKWRRSRQYPDADQRLKPAHDHHGPSQPRRTWIAVAILLAVLGIGIWLLVTNGADESDDWPYDDQFLEDDSSG